MPRGRRKRGAWDCQVWFENGDYYRLTSLPDRTFPNAEIAKSIRTNLLPMLEAAEAATAVNAGAKRKT